MGGLSRYVSTIQSERHFSYVVTYRFSLAILRRRHRTERDLTPNPSNIFTHILAHILSCTYTIHTYLPDLCQTADCARAQTLVHGSLSYGSGCLMTHIPHHPRPAWCAQEQSREYSHHRQLAACPAFITLSLHCVQAPSSQASLTAEGRRRGCHSPRLSTTQCGKPRYHPIEQATVGITTRWPLSMAQHLHPWRQWRRSTREPVRVECGLDVDR